MLLQKDLSNFELEIVQVAIESLDDKEPPSLKSKAAVIYITYKDLAKARSGEPYHWWALSLPSCCETSNQRGYKNIEHPRW